MMHPYVDIAAVSEAIDIDIAMQAAVEQLHSWPENKLGAMFVWDYNGQIGFGEQLPRMPGAIIHMVLSTDGYEDIATGLVERYEEG